MQLKNKKDYQKALERLELIFDSKKGSPEGDEHFPIGFPDPIEAIKFRMEQMGYNQTDLAKVIGLKSRASEITEQEKKIDTGNDRLLHDSLKIPTEVLIQAYK